MFNAEGIIKSLLKVLNIEPEEANSMVKTVVGNVQQVDERLARIEKQLGIEPDRMDTNVTHIERGNSDENIRTENGT